MSRARYQLLSTNDQVGEDLENDQTPSTESAQTTIQPLAVNAQDQMQEINLDSTQQPPTGAQITTNSQAPPSLAELPSYTEAVRLKKLEADSNDLPPAYFAPGANGPVSSSASDQARFAIDPTDVIHGIVDDSHMYEQDIGSECMFLSAFMIAFFFNWIGFFASICLLPNAAGKYGALSGFGLSMAKWVTIVRYQEWMNYMNDFQQKLFFWLFIFLGFYLFFRGLINYMTLKYRPIASIEYTRRNRWFTFMD